jgi:hypothetical protein
VIGPRLGCINTELKLEERKEKKIQKHSTAYLCFSPVSFPLLLPRAASLLFFFLIPEIARAFSPRTSHGSGSTLLDDVPWVELRACCVALVSRFGFELETHA